MKYPIRIKLIARGLSGHAWARQMPASGSFTNECRFLFDLRETAYDWLVVIDDVSRKFAAKPEILACADEHTLLVTTEPPTITCYGAAFSGQFAHVLTSQPPTALRHPSRIYSHTGNLWFNDHSYLDLNDSDLPSKSEVLSTVCSSKQQKHTLHNTRHSFCHWLLGKIPEMDLFGHGHRPMQHKYHALDPYRFHLAIENYRGLHHWTEKLADSFLSGSFPFYYGCTNIGDYFPAESLLEIDLFDRAAALNLIRGTITNDGFYESRREALLEARRLVLNDYNLLHMIEFFVVVHFSAERSASRRSLLGRKQMRMRQPADALHHAKWHFARHFKQVCQDPGRDSVKSAIFL